MVSTLSIRKPLKTGVILRTPLLVQTLPLGGSNRWSLGKWHRFRGLYLPQTLVRFSWEIRRSRKKIEAFLNPSETHWCSAIYRIIGIIWVLPKIGVPQNGWFAMENPVKMDDLGENPPFWETPISPFISGFWAHLVLEVIDSRSFVSWFISPDITGRN